MKPDIDRVRNDLETMHKALGVAPSMGRDWIHWMKRDKWIGLWWCLPGFIIMADAAVPHDRTQRYGGLVFDQWAGLLVAAVMLALAHFLTRRIGADDGRPDGLIREAKRANGMSAEGVWFSAALIGEAVLYFIWGRRFGIPFEAFWAGLFLFFGSTCLVAALVSKTWTLLGWAVPFLGYAICLLFVHSSGKVNGLLLGGMFVAVALSFSLISVLQIRLLERQDAAD